MTETGLDSWRDGASKAAILDFLARATTPGPDFVPPADRIAAFDNDGTLWVEQPMPPQLDFLLRTWSREARDDPSLADQQPYKAIIEKDPSFFEGAVTQVPEVVASLEDALARSWAGTTPEEFDSQVRERVATAEQPRFGVPYVDLVYRPMLELFALLETHEFRVFVCSGGGRDFMRVFGEELWGIHKEAVIGSAAAYEYRDGKIIRTREGLGGVSLGPGKPEHIFATTGRLPVLAGGNSDGDIEMLESARLAVLVNHDDADREYAYTKGADVALARAADLGWLVVSMKDDWSTMF